MEGTTAEAAVGVAEAAVGVAEAMDTGVSVGVGRATDAGHRVARRSKKLQKKRMRGVEVGRSVALDLGEWGQMEGWVESKLASGSYEVYWRALHCVLGRATAQRFGSAKAKAEAGKAAHHGEKEAANRGELPSSSTQHR